MTQHIAIIGAGPGGYVAAIRLAQLGVKVTLIEANALGGVCLNWGCIPSKALLHVGHIWQQCQHAKEMGITLEGASLDWPTTLSWKDKQVEKLTGGIGQLLKAHGVTVLQGRARFISPKQLLIDPGLEQAPLTLDMDGCIIATGSDTAPLRALPIDGQMIWDARHALSCPVLPKDLVIVGAGIIGLEMATMFNQFGVPVKLVEKAPDLLPGWDKDVKQVLARQFKRKGIEILLDTGIDWVEQEENRLILGLSNGKTLTTSTVLVAAGRLPNSKGLDLENAGVVTDERGFITIDEQCRTNVPHILAIGDVTSAPLLAHKASKEGLVAAEVLAGQPAALDYQAMPSAVFTQPELASVGYTAEKAEALGYTVTTGSFPLSASGRAMIEGVPVGCLVKIVADAESDRVLGVHIAGPHAADMIAEATLAIELGATTSDLALTVHAHPTLPESLMEAAEAVHHMAIHTYQVPKRSPQLA
jgi:dihydrolipoamide dehydrogenase